VTFAVDAVRLTPKSEFPTTMVYGGWPNPVLRLITCGGQFDRRHGSYRANIIASATVLRQQR
jgi:hypothetical protein